MLAEAINVGNFKGDLQAIIDELKDQYIKQLSLRSAAGQCFHQALRTLSSKIKTIMFQVLLRLYLWNMRVTNIRYKI